MNIKDGEWVVGGLVRQECFEEGDTQWLAAEPE